MLMIFLHSTLAFAQEAGAVAPPADALPSWLLDGLKVIGPAATIPTTLSLWLYGTGRWRPAKNQENSMSNKNLKDQFDSLAEQVKDLKDRLEAYIQGDLERRLAEAERAGEIKVLLQQLLDRD